MKLYKRQDFLNLTYGTIYSRVNLDSGVLMRGLYCKTSEAGYYSNDWCEQDLISEAGFPNGITDGTEATTYQLDLRDSFMDFRTDLNCSGRDGMYEDDECFVVWDKTDITKLVDYLNESLTNYP